jgi:hypothetical protein
MLGREIAHERAKLWLLVDDLLLQLFATLT